MRDYSLKCLRVDVYNFALTLYNATMFLRNILRIRIFNPSGTKYTTSSYEYIVLNLKSQVQANLHRVASQWMLRHAHFVLFPSFPHLPSYDGLVRPIVSRWRGLCHKCRVAYPGSRRQIGATVYTTNSILVHTFGDSSPV